MSDTVIKVENLSKQYRLGMLGTGTLLHDLNRWAHKVTGKGDPYLKIGEVNNRAEKGNSDMVWVLNDINFDVKRGEVLGVIGRNGAGKSTLLKILSRITSPTKGTFKVKGKIASLLEVGTGFHPDLSGRENIFLNGAILGMTKREIRSRLDEIIDFSGIARYVDTPVKRYSSGMYVRLAFAVAAHLESEIMIVDEVLAVGDVEFQKKCLGKMQDVSRNQGRTVLFVSHNMQAVSTLTTRCALLQMGELAFLGDTPAAISMYLQAENISKFTYEMNSSETYPLVTKMVLFTSLPNNTHLNGEEMIIEFDVSTPIPLNGAALSFQIINEYERAIVHAWNFDSEIPFARTPGKYKLRCTLPKVKLYMGRYTFTVHLGEVGTGKKLHTIEKVCPFEIVMFGKKRDYNWVPDTCVYLEDNKWDVTSVT